MIGRYSKGSYLGATPTAPSMYGASGMWSLSSAARYRVDDEWPQLLTPPEPPVIVSASIYQGEFAGELLLQWLTPASQLPILDYEITATDLLTGLATTQPALGGDTSKYMYLTARRPYSITMSARSAAGYGLPSAPKGILAGTETVPSAPTITSITVSETV